MQPKYDPIGRIIARVAEEFGIAVEVLVGRSQTRDVSEARAAAAYVIRTCLPAVSLVTIGQRLGGRDHTTIIKALERVQERMDASAAHAEVLGTLIQELMPTMPRSIAVPQQRKRTQTLTPQLRLALTLYGVQQAMAA